MKGFFVVAKEYVIDNPNLIKEWHFEKNDELGFDPKKLTCGSNKKVWWKCAKGHEWQAVINLRSRGSGCPYCSGRNAIKGENDLQTVNPSLAKEWNYEKNYPLTPSDVSPNSNKKAWWKCEKGHKWQAIIVSRHKEHGCPYCAGRYSIKGENDLQTVNPALAREWNYEKNNGLTPMDVMSNSGIKVWWKCNQGHEWQATVDNRNKGNKCPICQSERTTSFPEYAIVYYLEKYGLETIHSYRERGYELDIYIPSKNIAIEYDGGFWHKNRIEKDLEKNFKCKKDGIQLYRIREGLPSLNDSSIDYVIQEYQKYFSEVLEKILSEIIGEKIDVDLNRDAVAIENLREHTKKENSLLISNPNLAKEWHYEKNGLLRPEYIFANSNKKVWWRCAKGHEWKSTINSRNQGSGCPYCSNNKVLKDYNDLQTLNPILAKEWDYKKNTGLAPTDVTLNSHLTVWWKCEKGHSYQAMVKNRNEGTKCPYCSNKKAFCSENDLQTVNPTLAKEWNYKKNDGLSPSDVLPNSGKKVWWKCQKGHEWQATIASRNRGNGCPQCAREKRKNK